MKPLALIHEQYLPALGVRLSSGLFRQIKIPFRLNTRMDPHSSWYSQIFLMNRNDKPEIFTFNMKNYRWGEFRAGIPLSRDPIDLHISLAN